MTINTAFLVAIIALIVWALTSIWAKTPKTTQVAWFVFQAALLAFMIDKIGFRTSHLF